MPYTTYRHWRFVSDGLSKTTGADNLIRLIPGVDRIRPNFREVLWLQRIWFEFWDRQTARGDVW